MTFAEAKRVLRVEQILESHGVKRRGRKWVCPFHEDHHPSLVVRKRDRGDTWRCYGCGAFGDAIDLLVRLEGDGALQKLGIEPSKDRRRPTSKRKDKKNTRLDAIRKKMTTAETYPAVTASVIEYMKTMEEENP